MATSEKLWTHVIPDEHKDKTGKQEGALHASRRGHGIDFSRDDSWLCRDCESSFDYPSGTLTLNDVTLSQLKLIKKALSE